MSAITYTITDAMEALQQAEELQQAVWGMTQSEVLGATTMRWITHIGGFFIGAWDEDTMIGFCIASLGKRENKWVLWSDMAGIRPGYQGLGVGHEIKQRQKVWAREQGLEEIRWTFDPMRSGNASFNFHKLGASSHMYHREFYGHMEDEINRGLPADRLEAVWSTANMPYNSRPVDHDAPFAVQWDGTLVQQQLVDEHQVRIEIPIDLNHLKTNNLNLAQQWQQSVRAAFGHYFANGYQANDFQRVSGRCWYILNKLS